MTEADARRHTARHTYESDEPMDEPEAGARNDPKTRNGTQCIA